MPPTRQYLPIRPFSRRYRIWDIAPLQRRNIDLLCVSIYPSSSAVADIGYGILPHVGIYLSPFPARNIGYGICPVRVSIYLSAFSHRYTILEYWILPHVSIYLSPLSSPKYRIWDMHPTRPYLPIRRFSRRYKMWDIAPRPQM